MIIQSKKVKSTFFKFNSNFYDKIALLKKGVK